jgi:hypothetical protein
MTQAIGSQIHVSDKELKIIRDILRSALSGELVYVFGSRARGDHRHTALSNCKHAGGAKGHDALLARRVRSRDLYDLKVMLDRHGYSVRQLFAAIGRVDPGANPDVHRDVLRGLVPLDVEDEGFASIGVQETVADLYAFFRLRIDAFEREEARRIVDSVRGR